MKHSYVDNFRKGDFYRYVTEVTNGDAKKENAEMCLRSYRTAMELSNMELAPTDSTRLSLALNCGVFYMEILNSVEKACLITKQAYDDALAEIDSLNEDDYNEASTMMQFLRYNLNLWSKDAHDNDDSDEDD